MNFLLNVKNGKSKGLKIVYYIFATHL